MKRLWIQSYPFELFQDEGAKGEVLPKRGHEEDRRWRSERTQWIESSGRGQELEPLRKIRGSRITGRKYGGRIPDDFQPSSPRRWHAEHTASHYPRRHGFRCFFFGRSAAGPAAAAGGSRSSYCTVQALGSRIQRAGGAGGEERNVDGPIGAGVGDEHAQHEQEFGGFHLRKRV